MIGWKECPEAINGGRKYSFEEGDPAIATKIGNSCSTIIGSTPFPRGAVSSCVIKVVQKSKRGGGGLSSYVGVAPIDIDQDEDSNFEACGWYLECGGGSLYSGPPHSFVGKAYGPRKGGEPCVSPRGIFGVVVDTAAGEVSFVVGEINLGVAYAGVPLDKPLVPCALLVNGGDSARLYPSDARGSSNNNNKVSSDVPVPANVSAKGQGWGSIRLSWDGVKGALFYQVEVDGSGAWCCAAGRTYSVKGLVAESEHAFRVRAVRGCCVSEWSCAVVGRTGRMCLETSAWKECPERVCPSRRYVVGAEDPRVAKKATADGEYCTVVGDTALPVGSVASWHVSVLCDGESEDNGNSKNNGDSKNKNKNNAWVGVAPVDIDQDKSSGSPRCGWYVGYPRPALCSGPPHRYRNQAYGPRGTRVDRVVGVVMDTGAGRLSFVLNGVDFGVAYEGIPLDRPLVPAVVLGSRHGGAMLCPAPVRACEANCEVCVPRNVRTKSTAWDSITVVWDAVDYATYYQVEHDASRGFGAAAAPRYTIGVLEAATGYNIRVRAVRDKEVSGWSEPIREFTQKPYFEYSEWRECAEEAGDAAAVGYGRYVLDEDSASVARKLGGGAASCAVVIGNTAVPAGRVTPWFVRVVEAGEGCEGIYVGVAPSGVGQGGCGGCGSEPLKCGWFLGCHGSALFSGPPHKYAGREYGPRKGKGCGEYLAKGECVGVVMDTTNATRGELSFVLGFESLGAAFKGIPLDKPLVPCVLLTRDGDAVELIAREERMPRKEASAKGKKGGKGDKDCIVS